MFQKCALLAMSKIPQNMPEKLLSMLLPIDRLLVATIGNPPKSIQLWIINGHKLPP